MYQKLHPEARNKPFQAKLLAYYEYYRNVRKQDSTAAIHRCVRYFMTSEQLHDRKYVKKIQIDMLYCKIFYGITLEDYFVFQFENKSDEERATYLGEPEMMELCDRFAFEEGRLFRNKYLTYLTFQPFYQREMILVKNERDAAEITSFLKRHQICMRKALDQSQGRALQKIDIQQEGLPLEAIVYQILQGGECILEELIIQSEEMAKYHPSSVNTIRFATYYQENGQKNLFALLRMGIGDSVIDNASAGGIFAEVDVQTGIVKSLGMRRNGECYSKHPDSGVLIQGAVIPKWNELLAVIEKLVCVVPKQKYVGWDMALTDSGWVMVEGNHKAAATGIQICRKKGMKNEFLELFFGRNNMM